MFGPAERELLLQLRRIRKAEYLAIDRYFKATEKDGVEPENEREPVQSRNGR
jgi:hypothetical protein